MPVNDNNPCLLVISDTHGDVKALAAVLSWAQNRNTISALAFLGDGAADLPLAAERAGFTLPTLVVRGNGDFEPGLLSSAVADFGGRRFFLCHGHLHGAGTNLESLCAAARSVKAHAALYGHTHVPYWEEFGSGEDSLLVLNPGSLGRPRTRKGPSFATIECPNGGGGWFTVHHWGYEKGWPAPRIFELAL